MKKCTSIDIFCAVVDNYGDIGVCWRLARQAAAERGLKTRLYVDDVSVARKIVPENTEGVELIPWDAALRYESAADIVIEGFGCRLPDIVLNIIGRDRPVWIDLEYLTAEDWAVGCHGIPSLVPAQNVKKTLFFPGFDDRTGGLIREKDLFLRRDAFLSDKNAQNIWRKRNFMPERRDDTLDISLFCYPSAPMEGLYEGLKASGQKVRGFCPVSRSASLLSATLREKSGEFELYEIPFLSQYDYDYFLWTCDLNFVRGEDSFVRAFFAGKPFIWNIYVQEKEAHLVKLRAFLDFVRPYYDADCFETLAKAHDLWNEGAQKNKNEGAGLWENVLKTLAGLELGARRLSDSSQDRSDLLTRLLTFAHTQRTEK